MIPGRSPAQVFKVEALLYVLEPRGVLKCTEGPEQIKQMRKAAKAQGTRPASSRPTSLGSQE